MAAEAVTAEETKRLFDLMDLNHFTNDEIGMALEHIPFLKTNERCRRISDLWKDESVPGAVRRTMAEIQVHFEMKELDSKRMLVRFDDLFTLLAEAKHDGSAVHAKVIAKMAEMLAHSDPKVNAVVKEQLELRLRGYGFKSTMKDAAKKLALFSIPYLMINATVALPMAVVKYWDQKELDPFGVKICVGDGLVIRGDYYEGPGAVREGCAQGIFCFVEGEAAVHEGSRAPVGVGVRGAD